MCFRAILAAIIATLTGVVCEGQNPAGKPALFIIGDSTVKNGTKGQMGWGEGIATHFDTAKITIANHAIGGRSSRTFLTEGRWDKVLDQLKAGDFVLMQFGHNDSGPLDDKQRARGSLRGVGEETREIDNPITKKHEVVHTYGWYLRKYIADTKAKGATPIVCSPVPRNIWKNGAVGRGTNDYAKWAAEVARHADAQFLDLNEIIARRYEQRGEQEVQGLFFGDHTHTSPDGARFSAQAVADGLRALSGCPLCPYMSAPAISRP